MGEKNVCMISLESIFCQLRLYFKLSCTMIHCAKNATLDICTPKYESLPCRKLQNLGSMSNFHNLFLLCRFD